MGCLAGESKTILQIYNKLNSEKTKFNVKLLLRQSDWETSSLGRYQAAKRGRMVSLDNNQLLVGTIKESTAAEKDAFWTAIIKEFRKKLFN
jgi:internalin A